MPIFDSEYCRITKVRCCIVVIYLVGVRRADEMKQLEDALVPMPDRDMRRKVLRVVWPGRYGQGSACARGH